MQNPNEKKFYRGIENGKISYFMVDLKSVEVYGHIHVYPKYKPCHLEFIDKELIALNPDKDRSYGYRYNYKIVPSTERFRKVHKHKTYVHKDMLITEDISEIKDKHI